MNKLQDTGSLAVVEAIDKLEMLYDAALAALRDAISAFIRDGSLPNAAERSKGLFSYPQLSVRWMVNLAIITARVHTGAFPGQGNTAPQSLDPHCSGNI